MTIKQLSSQLSLNDVQTMNSVYYTLKPDHILLNELVDIFPAYAESAANVREFYNYAILNYYPNEITIKAAFLNHMLFGKRHTTTIFELPVEGSRADLCTINGSSTAYEIKTDLDNLSRLGKQITDYQKVFEQVYIICSEVRLPKIIDEVPECCGIYTYTCSSHKRYKFMKYRRSMTSTSVESVRQLSLFRSKELYDAFPGCSSSCKDEAVEMIAKAHTSAEINQKFKRILKERYSEQWAFLESNRYKIYEIDYQWFFCSKTDPQLIYGS